MLGLARNENAFINILFSLVHSSCHLQTLKS